MNQWVSGLQRTRCLLHGCIYGSCKGRLLWGRRGLLREKKISLLSNSLKSKLKFLLGSTGRGRIQAVMWAGYSWHREEWEISRKRISGKEEGRGHGRIYDFFLPIPGQVLGCNIKNNQIRFRYMGAGGLSPHSPGHRLGFQFPSKKENQQSASRWQVGMALNGGEGVSSSSILPSSNHGGTSTRIWSGQRKDYKFPSMGFSSRYQEDAQCPGRMRNGLTEFREGQEHMLDLCLEL